jgi:hypothetical protein
MRMFGTARQQGADQILELGRRVVAEFARTTGRSIRVLGWCGSDGKMNWEFVVEIDGHGCGLAVGDHDLSTFPHDERVRADVEERIRHQTQCGLELISPS